MLDDHFQDTSGERPSLALTAVMTVLARAGRRKQEKGSQFVSGTIWRAAVFILD